MRKRREKIGNQRAAIFQWGCPYEFLHISNVDHYVKERWDYYESDDVYKLSGDLVLVTTNLPKLSTEQIEKMVKTFFDLDLEEYQLPGGDKIQLYEA